MYQLKYIRINMIPFKLCKKLVDYYESVDDQGKLQQQIISNKTIFPIAIMYHQNYEIKFYEDINGVVCANLSANHEVSGRKITEDRIYHQGYLYCTKVSDMNHDQKKKFVFKISYMKICHFDLENETVSVW